MSEHSPTIGFIGAGRITSIFLSALERRPDGIGQITVSDAAPDVLRRLVGRFPDLEAAEDNRAPARQDVIFVALHPPILRKALPGLASALAPSAVVVSLAPVVSLAELSRLLDGFGRLVRMIPNAASLLGEGFNPSVFGPGLGAQDRERLHGLFSAFGSCPEVAEEKLEAYAILTAMGPTYLWFQLELLRELGNSFGLTDEEARTGLAAMAHGATRLLLESGLPAAEVMDTIPVKPLGEEAPAIEEAYRRRLVPLHRKLTGRPGG